MATTIKLHEKYIEMCLSSSQPINVFTFCKHAEIKEEDFYKEYGSIDGLKKDVFKIPFNETIAILQADDNYKEYNAHEKMLAFFYTWVQQLSSIRTWILHEEKHSHIGFYKDMCYALYHDFHDYAERVISESIAKGELPSRQYLDQTYPKALWGQLIFLFKFWVHDTSKGFEQTDAAIEKSVRVAFDLMGNSVVDSVFDFGRFMMGQLQRR